MPRSILATFIGSFGAVELVVPALPAVGHRFHFLDEPEKKYIVQNIDWGIPNGLGELVVDVHLDDA